MYSKMQSKRMICPVQAHECLSACTGNLLASKYLLLSGNEIIIAGGGLRVTYNTETKVIGSSMYQANFRFAERYNIVSQHDRLSPESDPALFIKEAIEAQKYLLIRLNAKSLNYDRVFKQAENASHFANVVETKDNAYLICDGYVPSRIASTFYGEVPCAEILQAWQEMEYEYYLFDDIPDLDEQKIIADVWHALINGLHLYRLGGRERNLFLGKDAITELFRELDCVNRERVLEVNFQLKIFGFLSLKQIICEVLKKKEGMEDIIAQYYGIIKEWEKICLMMIKIGLSPRKTPFESLQLRVFDCIEAEDKLQGIIVHLLQ